MKDFRSLIVWERAHQLTLQVYKESRRFPDTEKFGLTSQLRRSAASIGANIAEGCGRGSELEFRRYLQIAMGSASETEYHLLLAKDLEILSREVHAPLEKTTQEVKRMLPSLINKLSAES